MEETKNLDMGVKLAGVKREFSFSFKQDEDSTKQEVTVLVDFSNMTLEDLLDKARRSITIDIQAVLRKLPDTQSVTAFLDKVYIPGQKTVLPPEVRVANAAALMSDEQKLELIAKLQAMIKSN